MPSTKNVIEQKKNGITLVEILVVSAIMVVMAAILFPVLRSAKEDSYHSVSISNLHQLGIGQTIYTQDYGIAARGAPQLVMAGVVPKAILDNPADISQNGLANEWLEQMRRILPGNPVLKERIQNYKSSYIGLWETLAQPAPCLAGQPEEGWLVDISYPHKHLPIPGEPIGADLERYLSLELDGSVRSKHAIYQGQCGPDGNGCQNSWGTWFADGDQEWQLRWYNNSKECYTLSNDR